MTVTTAPGQSRAELTLDVYRDDGPLSRALGRTIGRRLAVPPIALIVAGLLPAAVVLVLKGDGASDSAVAACVAFMVLCVGMSSGRPHTDSLRWAVPAGLRLAEYAAVLWIAAIAAGTAPAAAFALLAVVAFRHYDLVYRLRAQGGPPPRWVGDVAGGWEGRVLLAVALLVADAVPGGFYALAAALAVLFVTESVLSWTHVQRGAVAEYEDEEAGEE